MSQQQRRSRVKLDFGSNGKVIASVSRYEEARAVAATRLKVSPASVQLYVRDGEDLWELDPSAFDDVVSENGIILVATDATAAGSHAAPDTPVQQHVQPGPVTASPVVPSTPFSNPAPAAGFVSPYPTSQTAIAHSSSASTILRPDNKVEFAPAGPLPQTTTAAQAVTRLNQAVAHSVDSSDDESDSSSSSSASTSSESSSSSSGSSSSPSPSHRSISPESDDETDRRSESVQDVTATSALVRAGVGPNGFPISSKERWDPKTHKLMFAKLNDIINSETIYYTRKYTEERYRIFRMLIEQYGDDGTKGNFLRGRTVIALISRVASVLRTARERGEKIKQPFKFFFPNRKGDEPKSLLPSSSSILDTLNGPSGSSRSTAATSTSMQTSMAPPQINRRTHSRDSVRNAKTGARGKGRVKGKGRGGRHNTGADRDTNATGQDRGPPRSAHPNAPPGPQSRPPNGRSNNENPRSASRPTQEHPEQDRRDDSRGRTTSRRPTQHGSAQHQRRSQSPPHTYDAGSAALPTRSSPRLSNRRHGRTTSPPPHWRGREDGWEDGASEFRSDSRTRSRISQTERLQTPLRSRSHNNDDGTRSHPTSVLSNRVGSARRNQSQPSHLSTNSRRRQSEGAPALSGGARDAAYHAHRGTTAHPDAGARGWGRTAPLFRAETQSPSASVEIRGVGRRAADDAPAFGLGVAEFSSYHHQGRAAQPASHPPRHLTSENAKLERSGWSPEPPRTPPR
ncbi:hypothetical protein BCV70DRAFT_201215 [Testicularia cyperi]|uniref:Ubiquitin-like domain-containing protein n=1 Tax=Testicularia cyperi TaxID=1882483 RepID=A0A317XL22_9BASI|nr:hypothetical protein BCV70DRAFT_201215 [Testicularia cyperi]